GERELFHHIRDWDHWVHYIFLELHTEFLPLPELFECLESSAFRWAIHETPPPGASIVILTLERWERRLGTVQVPCSTHPELAFGSSACRYTVLTPLNVDDLKTTLI